MEADERSGREERERRKMHDESHKSNLHLKLYPLYHVVYAEMKMEQGGWWRWKKIKVYQSHNLGGSRKRKNGFEKFEHNRDVEVEPNKQLAFVDSNSSSSGNFPLRTFQCKFISIRHISAYQIEI
jgi:hypothetical protein